MLYALAVLSTVLLLLIIGFVFKSDFRQDIMKGEHANEASFRGVTIKGAMFWVIYALTAFGTIYLGIEQGKKEGVSSINITNPKPLEITTEHNHEWIALDIESGKQAELFYIMGDTKIPVKQSNRTSARLNLKVEIDSSTRSNDIVVSTDRGGFKLGEIKRNNFNTLIKSPNIKLEESIDIYYTIQLSPFKSKKLKTSDYKWNSYKRLPFTVEPKFAEGDMFLGLRVKGQDTESRYDIHKDFSEIIEDGDKAYILTSVSSDTTPGGNDEHVHLRITIMPLSCSILEG